LIRDAQAVLAGCGITRSPAWVSRTVRAYVNGTGARAGLPFVRHLIARLELSAEARARAERHPDIANLLAYADPTGETAVAHVMRGQR
jgi:hypothetical protein